MAGVRLGRSRKYHEYDQYTAEEWVEMIGDNPLLLENVPESLKTPELCQIAVQEQARTLEYVPEALKMLELCLMAVRKDGYALEYVPESLRTPEFLAKAAELED